MDMKTLKNTISTFTIAGILTLTGLPVDAALGDSVLKIGMDHEDIQVLQEELKSIGYFDNNEITTYYGDITLNAVKNFQREQGLAEDGIFGSSTYEALNKYKLSQLSNLIEAEARDNKSLILSYTRDLNLDVSGPDVKDLQDALKKLGYLRIDETTDYYGTQTMEAVSLFQESYGLYIDGIAGSNTISTLNEVLGGRKEVKLAPTRSNVNRSKSADLITTAKKYLGVPYSYGSASPRGFDCSGFTQFVYKQHGISIPRATTGQATTGTKLSKSELQVGDLIIFSNTYKAGPSHAGIYMGNGQFIHASSVGSGGVVISDLNSAYYSGKFSYGRRVY